MLVIWHVIPFLIRLISKKSKLDFDPDLYRKLAFYSPVAVVIFLAMFELPINVMIQIFGGIGVKSKAVLIFVGFLAIVLGIVSIYALVLIISSIVILCKGLSRFFGLNAWQIILVQFIVPAIVFLPLFLIRLPKFWEFVMNYTNLK